MKKKIKYIIIVALMMILMPCVNTEAISKITLNNYKNVKSEEKGLNNKSIYCWHQDPLYTSNIESTIKKLNSLKVSNIYFSFKNIQDSKEMISKLNENGISIYYLTGDPSWYNSPDTIKKRIDEIYNYNNKNEDNIIPGIVLDIEPYIEADYKSDVIKGFETYANTMEEVYEYAKSKNIKLINTIPYWYDKYMTDEELTEEEHARAQESFEKLIKSADKTSIMNYYKTKMVSHIENEVEYAKRYNKEIESIAEFKEPVGDSIPETCTFYIEEEPIKKANIEWQKIYDEYNYENLKFSYHDLSTILEIYKESKKYIFEFIDTNSDVVSIDKYKIVFSSGKSLDENITSIIEMNDDEQYDIYLDGYNIQELVSEENIKDDIIKRTYLVKKEESNQEYSLEVYPKYWNGSRYASIKKGKVRIVNVETGEEQIEKITGNSDSGYYTYLKVYANTTYKVYILDKKGKKLNYRIDNVEYKDANKVKHTIKGKNGTISFPEGLESKLYPKFNMK